MRNDNANFRVTKNFLLIAEIILKRVFQVTMENTTTASTVTLFDRFNRFKLFKAGRLVKCERMFRSIVYEQVR